MHIGLHPAPSSLFILATAAHGQTYRGEISERLATPVIASFQSVKPIHDLEICVADAISVLGFPILLRDGPDTVTMLMSVARGPGYIGSVSFIKTMAGTRLDLRLRGKGWNDRLSERIAGCTTPA